MIKGVFFDLDGTLIKSMHFHFQGWKKVLSKNNVNIEKSALLVRPTACELISASIK